MSIDKNATHYDVGGIETIEVIRAKLTKDQFIGFLLGNVVKYSLRCNHKGCFNADIRKLKVYSGLLDDERKQTQWEAEQEVGGD